ncbi:MAG: hypothetical protein JO093_12920 [Acidobacteria bacterium]|nr:hypothetical protein [Acidobacteriota bacterium]MBV9067296.1 hypothetical protein [Acidobacteriota bacterium]MBV9186517.1 hypothetical protein [Acidobacteriota bacterium]
MARWLIKLAAEDADLEEYVRWFPAGEIFALREDKDVYLSGAIFENLTDVGAVRKEAESQLTVLTCAASLFWPALRKPTIDRVIREQDDGTRSGFMLLSASVTIRAKMTASLDDTLRPTQAQELLELAKKRPRLLVALQLWGEEPKMWPRLYRILEEIEQHLGIDVDKGGLCSSAERTRFMRTANTAEVAGSDSRHALGKFLPPSNPMTLSEAESFISRMLQAALRRA